MLAEATLYVPAWLWLPLAGTSGLVLAWHAYVAPRLIARRRKKRLDYAYRAMRFENHGR